MHFAELNEGDYQVYASAIPKVSGYLAAVMVCRVKGPLAVPQVAYRNLALDDGRRWPRAEDALVYAVDHAQHLIWDELSQLSC